MVRLLAASWAGARSPGLSEKISHPERQTPLPKRRCSLEQSGKARLLEIPLLVGVGGHDRGYP
jgi:hypothetical protein